MAENRTISLTPEAVEVFDTLKMRMPGVSFSGSLKKVAEHYIKCKTSGRFMPEYLDDIRRWDKYVRGIEMSELKTLQERLIQLDNLFRMRTMKWL